MSGTIETMNQWRYNLFDNRPMMLAEQTVAQSVPNNTFTKITFTTLLYDNFGGYSTGLSTYTVQLAGIYRVSGQIQWTANATPARFIRVLHNGTSTGLLSVSDNCSADITTSSALTTLVSCSIGDTLVIQGDQNSGVALNTQAGAAGGINYNSWFTAVWLRPQET